MSLMRRFGMRSLAGSFVEMILFFGVITPLCLLGVPYLIVGLTQGFGGTPSMLEPSTLIPMLPAWVAQLVGVGYLAMLMFYWMPGEKADSDAELRGFVLFVIAALVVAGAMLQHYYGTLTSIWDPLREVYWPAHAG